MRVQVNEERESERKRGGVTVRILPLLHGYIKPLLCGSYRDSGEVVHVPPEYWGSQPSPGGNIAMLVKQGRAEVVR